MAQIMRRAKDIQEKSRQHTVVRLTPNSYRVTSPESNRSYIVNLGINGGTCTCPWGQYRPDDDRRSACSHVVAAINYRAETKGRRISAWSTLKAARRQHRPVLPIGDGIVLTSRLD